MVRVRVGVGLAASIARRPAQAERGAWSVERAGAQRGSGVRKWGADVGARRGGARRRRRAEAAGGAQEAQETADVAGAVAVRWAEASCAVR